MSATGLMRPVAAAPMSSEQARMRRRLTSPLLPPSVGLHRTAIAGGKFFKILGVLAQGGEMHTGQMHVFSSFQLRCGGFAAWLSLPLVSQARLALGCRIKIQAGASARVARSRTAALWCDLPPWAEWTGGCCVLSPRCG